MVTHQSPVLCIKGSSVDGAPPIHQPTCCNSGQQAIHGRPPEVITNGKGQLGQSTILGDSSPNHADVDIHGRPPEQGTTPKCACAPTAVVGSPATTGTNFPAGNVHGRPSEEVYTSSKSHSSLCGDSLPKFPAENDHGRPLEEVTTPSRAWLPAFANDTPATTGSLIKPPVCVSWACGDSDWDSCGPASSVGSVAQTYDIFSSEDETAEAPDRKLSYDLQHVVHGTTPSSWLLAAAEQLAAEGNPGIDDVDKFVVQRALRVTDPPHTPRGTAEQIAVDSNALAESLMKCSAPKLCVSDPSEQEQDNPAPIVLAGVGC